MKTVNNQIWIQIWDQVRDQLRKSTRDSVGDLVWYQVHRMSNQTYLEIQNRIESQISEYEISE